MVKAFIDSVEYRHRFGDAPERNQQALVADAKAGWGSRRMEIKRFKSWKAANLHAAI
jgi:hypothetical protein